MGGKNMIRICSAQCASIWENPEATLKKIIPLVRHAAASGADLICFPEQFATGWNPLTKLNIESSRGSVVSTLRGLAEETNIAILGSFREENTPLPKNTAIVIGKDGRDIARYSKIHLFSPGGEDKGFAPGSELGLFRLGPLTCGIAICYDLRFPELFRIYARHGVQAVFVPAAWPESRMKHWELFITARACENQMYVSGINTTGRTPVDPYTGGSMTADPHGSIICRANAAEQLLFCDLDPDAVEHIRASFPVAKDCREDLYHTLSVRKDN
jgi:predicted amidohydrolase